MNRHRQVIKSVLDYAWDPASTTSIFLEEGMALDEYELYVDFIYENQLYMDEMELAETLCNITEQWFEGLHSVYANIAVARLVVSVCDLLTQQTIEEIVWKTQEEVSETTYFFPMLGEGL